MLLRNIKKIGIIQKYNNSKLYFFLKIKKKKIAQKQNKKFCFRVHETTHKKIENIK